MPKEKKGSGYKAALEKFRNRLRLGKIKTDYTVKKGQTISDILADVYGDFIKSGTDAQWYARDLINRNNLQSLRAGMTLKLIKPRRYNPDYSPFDVAGGGGGGGTGKPGGKAPAAKAPLPAYNTGAQPNRPGYGKYVAPGNPELRDPTRGLPARATTSNTRPNRPGYGKYVAPRAAPQLATNPELRDPTRGQLKQRRNTKMKAPLITDQLADRIAGKGFTQYVMSPLANALGNVNRVVSNASATFNAALNAGINLQPGGQPYNRARPGVPFSGGQRPKQNQQAAPIAPLTGVGRGPQNWPGGIQFAGPRGSVAIAAQSFQRYINSGGDDSLLPQFLTSKDIEYLTLPTDETFQNSNLSGYNIDPGWIARNYEMNKDGIWEKIVGAGVGGGGYSAGAYVPMSGFAYSGGGYGGGGGGRSYAPIGYSPQDPYGYANSFGLVTWRI